MHSVCERSKPMYSTEAQLCLIQGLTGICAMPGSTEIDTAWRIMCSRVPVPSGVCRAYRVLRIGLLIDIRLSTDAMRLGSRSSSSTRCVESAGEKRRMSERSLRVDDVTRPPAMASRTRSAKSPAAKAAPAPARAAPAPPVSRAKSWLPRIVTDSSSDFCKEVGVYMAYVPYVTHLSGSERVWER